MALTKIQPPRLAQDFLERPRLLRRLEEIRAARTTVIQAPAGYGKTSLAVQFHRALQGAGARVGWLGLDSTQAEPMDFLTYVDAAMRAAGHRQDPAVDRLIGRESLLAPDVLATAIANSFVGSSEPLHLFIDDAHLLNETPAGAVLRLLIERSPPSLHFVLTSRERLDLPVSRWQALAESVTIQMTDLRFDEDEVATFMARAGHALGGQAVAAFAERIEGWPVGFRLASLALHAEQGGDDLLARFSGERAELWSFFSEDVLARLPPAFQTFLLQISVLDRLSPALCDAVTGCADGRALLDQCEAGGFFLVSLDRTRTWFRFHHLFGDFLRRLQSERMPGAECELHRRASAWFDTQGLYVEAVEHALRGGDPEGAASILDARADAMFSAGTPRVIRILADRLPTEIRDRHPRLMLAAAWPIIVNWRFEEAQRLIDLSRTQIDQMRRAGAAPEETAALDYVTRHREMMICKFQDDMRSVERMCVSLLKDGIGADPFLRGSTFTALINSRRQQFRLGDVDRLDREARQNLEKCRSLQVFVFHEAVMGYARMMGGRTDSADAHLRNGLDITIRLSGRAASLGASCALPLADLLFQRNELDEARALVDEYLPVSEHVGMVDQLISGHITRARFDRLDGFPARALQTLQKAAAIASAGQFRRMRLVVGLEQMQHLSDLGRPDDALHVARELGVGGATGAVQAKSGVCLADEAQAMIWVRAAAIEARLAEALTVARQWRNFTLAAGAQRNALEWELTLTRLYLLDGDRLAVQRAVSRACKLAAPERLVRRFLDEPALSDLVDVDTATGALLARSDLGNGGPDLNRANRITPAAAPDCAASGRIGGPLLNREVEILSMVGAGLLNREIGDRLGITEGSVKWYLQQIYDKIGVRRRSLALDRASQMGLIARRL